MKKILLAFLILFAVNIGCKKNIVEPVCGCSPAPMPPFFLSIKSVSGDDLLDVKNANSFTKEKIQLFHKDAAGVVKQIQFQLRPPFDANEAKFPYFNLVAVDLPYWAKNAVGGVFIKFGDGEPQEFKLGINANNNFVNKITIGNKDATLVTTGVEKLPIPVFSFILDINNSQI